MITQAATGADCKSAVLDFVGASPSSSTMNKDNEDMSMIYAYFMGLMTSAIVMIGFILVIEYIL